MDNGQDRDQFSLSLAGPRWAFHGGAGPAAGRARGVFYRVRGFLASALSRWPGAGEPLRQIGIALASYKASPERGRPVEDRFYGDRMGSLKDPFGHNWHIATHKEDVPAGELARRAEKAMRETAKA